MTVALAAILAAGIVLPHVLRLQRVPPMTAVVLWLSALALRAIASLLAVVYLLFFLPRTEVFSSLTHWCLHAMVPLITEELDVEGHGIGDLMLLVPGVGPRGRRCSWSASVPPGRHVPHDGLLRSTSSAKDPATASS